jgi:hypothetical protein
MQICVLLLFCDERLDLQAFQECWKLELRLLLQYLIMNELAQVYFCTNLNFIAPLC